MGRGSEGILLTPEDGGGVEMAAPGLFEISVGELDTPASLPEFGRGAATIKSCNVSGALDVEDACCVGRDIGLITTVPAQSRLRSNSDLAARRSVTRAVASG